MHAGDNVENIGRKRETFQVLQESRDRQESRVDGAPVPDQSVDYAVTGKDEGDHDVPLDRPSLKATTDEGIIVHEDTLYKKKGVKMFFILYFLKQKPPEITQDHTITEEQLKL